MVMALSLVLTMSRSGMTAFVASLVMTGWLVARVFDSRPRRIGAGICLAAVVVVVVGVHDEGLPAAGEPRRLAVAEPLLGAGVGHAQPSHALEAPGRHTRQRSSEAAVISPSPVGPTLSR